MPPSPRPVEPVCCRPLRAADVEPASGPMGFAFLDDPTTQYLFPDEPRRLARLRWLMEAFLRYGQQYGTAVVVGDEPVGTAVWVSSGNAHATLGRLLQTGWAWAPFKLGWLACRRLRTMMTAIEHARGRHMLNPHWYLLTLSVSPAHQRKGFGGILLRAMLDRAASQRIPCYLETFRSANLPFYQRHGFELLAESRVRGCQLPFWCMAHR